MLPRGSLLIQSTVVTAGVVCSILNLRECRGCPLAERSSRKAGFGRAEARADMSSVIVLPVAVLLVLASALIAFFIV
jgi:hypothetical protein